MEAPFFQQASHIDVTAHVRQLVPFFFSTTPSIPTPNPLIFKTSPSTLFFFEFSSCFSDYYLFYLKWFIKLECFFNFIILQIFFYLSNLVSVLLIAFFFIFLIFFIFQFNPSFVFLFNINTILDPHFFYCYFFKNFGWLRFLLRDFSDLPFMEQPDLMTRDTRVQRLAWFDFYLFLGSFFLPFVIILLDLQFRELCCFSFDEVIPISYPGLRFSRVNLGWISFFLYFFIFFSFSFNCFVHLNVHLHCFIQFLLYKVISPS